MLTILAILISLTIATLLKILAYLTIYTNITHNNNITITLQYALLWRVRGEKNSQLSEQSAKTGCEYKLHETLYSYASDRIERGVTYTNPGIKESYLIFLMLYEFTLFSDNIKFYAQSCFQLSFQKLLRMILYNQAYTYR